MFGTDGGWDISMGPGMWISWIVLIVLIVVVVKALVGSGSSSSPGYQDSPLEILKARYARGEIGDEEFDHRRRELEK